jgi:hypothetical protein
MRHTDAADWYETTRARFMKRSEKIPSLRIATMGLNERADVAQGEIFLARSE